MEKRYLVVQINEANVFNDLNDGGDALVWVDVTWGGVTRTTKKFKKPNVHQKLYFKIPVPPEAQKTQSKLEIFLTEELQTKSEFHITVWADTSKMNLENMGGGSMCLDALGATGVKHEDLEFVDPTTKDRTSYTSRVHTDSIRLSSAFWPSSVNSVNCSVWFLKDMPQPGVDLSKLKAKTEDSYPTEEIASLIADKTYENAFENIISMNFLKDYDARTERCFFDLTMMDQYNSYHLLPLFLCKVTNPDQTVVEFDEDRNVVRGVRTFAEIAHYVRCIPY